MSARWQDSLARTVSIILCKRASVGVPIQLDQSPRDPGVDIVRHDRQSAIQNVPPYRRSDADPDSSGEIC